MNYLDENNVNTKATAMLLVAVGLIMVLLVGGAFSGGSLASLQNYTSDGLKGSSGYATERSIYKGEELAGKTDYAFGAGHIGYSSTEIKADAPKQLDNASFIRWAYMHGAGLDMGDLTVGPKKDKSTMLYHFRDYMQFSPQEDQLQRGDLIFMNNYSQGAIYLGDGKILANLGYGSGNDDTGVTITKLVPKELDDYSINMDEATSARGDLWKLSTIAKLKHESTFISSDTKESNKGESASKLMAGFIGISEHDLNGYIASRQVNFSWVQIKEHADSLSGNVAKVNYLLPYAKKLEQAPKQGNIKPKFKYDTSTKLHKEGLLVELSTSDSSYNAKVRKLNAYMNKVNHYDLYVYAKHGGSGEGGVDPYVVNYFNSNESANDEVRNGEDPKVPSAFVIENGTFKQVVNWDKELPVKYQ